MGSSYLVASVDKALRVLDCFAQPPHVYSIKELGDFTGYSPNQVFRIVQTLMACGYVRDDQTHGKYRLGWRVFGLTAALVASDALFQAVREPLTEAYNALNQTVSVLVPDGESATIGVGTFHRGSPLLISEIDDQRNEDLHAGAAGHVVMASFPDTKIEQYISTRSPLTTFTPHTPTSAEQVWEVVRSTRAQGYGISMEECAIGMFGMAVPILGRVGEVVAVLTIAAPVASAKENDQARYLAVLQDTARHISRSLGFSGTPPLFSTIKAV